jgi:hypothetical protein
MVIHQPMRKREERIREGRGGWWEKWWVNREVMVERRERVGVVRE